MKLWPLAAIAVVGGLALGMSLVSGPDPNEVPTADEVSSRVMSPFCPGLTLDECPSDQADRVRAEIAEMVRRGDTNAEIDRWVVDNFGEVALARPGSTVAWLAPPLVALLGTAAVVLLLRRRVRPAAERPVQLSADDEMLFERDFQGYRKGSE
ncbi:MAG TPA: cytochrome c-type biogenesis protein CcmH [Actinomycetota bacterium]|nr:cytochrome c-type biogenesis protein CcmH [Actinomycetota bacterium]